jgi:hypothetical protein
MAPRIRKQIYIEPEQNTLLKQLSGQTGLPEAEIIRQALEHHVQALRIPWRDAGVWEAERAFILRLIQQGPVPGSRAWKREELHER